MLTLSRDSYDAGLKEIEFPSPVHLAFDELELGDLAFGLAVRPGWTKAAWTPAMSLVIPEAKEAIRVWLAAAIQGTRSASILFRTIL